MYITFLSPSLNKKSGGTRILTKYADLLSKKGHHVNILVISKNKFRSLIANILQLGKPNWIENFKPKIIRVPSFIEKYLPYSNIVIASAWQHAEYLNQYNNKISKFYLIQHDERLYHGNAKNVGDTYSSNLEKIVVSTWLKEMMEKDYNSDASLLINPVDTEYFFPRSKENSSDITILMQHHIYDWKGVADGLEALNRVKQKYPNIKLIMFGARQENIDVDCDEYYYDPPQKKIGELYAKCDIFLCPSWDEGFGLPSLQAIASQRALVTYDNGGSRDFAFDGDTAFVAKRKDIDDLTTKLELAVKNSDLREKIAKRGYKYSKTMPTWEQQTKKLEKILLKSLKYNA